MGAVKERLELDIDEVKEYLKLPDADDELMELLLCAALEYVDEFLNNPFENAEGEELDIPSSIKLGVLQLIGVMYQAQVTGDSNSIAGPVVEQEVGDVRVKYATMRLRGDTNELLSDPMLYTLLWQYRLIPGF